MFNIENVSINEFALKKKEFFIPGLRDGALISAQPGATKLSLQPGVSELTPPQPGAAKLPSSSGFWNSG